MDENTLNDLLECSVCLERLDTSSKVLPCQHTFCRKCLEVIVSSRQELRCPECRVLVEVKIDDLPPNVLLMRILEGMKNAAAQQHHKPLASKSSPDIRHISGPQQQQQPQMHINLHIHQLEEIQQGLQQHQHNGQIQMLQEQQLTPTQALPGNNSSGQQNTQQHFTQQRRCLLPHAYALYDFDSVEPSDLHFKKGDLVLLKAKIDSNWYVGQLNNGNGVVSEGTFPINHVQVIVPLPTPQCIALYDFRMPINEEQGCLTFKKGTVINVLRRVDHNWAEGCIGNSIGIFPIAFVELNKLAKQVLEMPYVVANMSTTSSTTPPTTVTTPLTATYSTANRVPHNLPHQLLDPPPRPHVDTANSDSIISSSPASNSSSSATSPQTTNTSSTTTTTLSSKTDAINGSRRAGGSSVSMPSSPNQSVPASPQHEVSSNNMTSGSSSVRFRDKREKRHSLNALLTAGNLQTRLGTSTTLSILQSNRHSAEILSIPADIHKFPDIEGQQKPSGSGGGSGQGAASTTCAAMPHIVNAREQQQQQQIQAQQSQLKLQVQPQQRVNVLKTNVVQQHVPPTLPWGYLALYPYKPRKSDELELKKGCVYIVTERCLDGWFKGKNWQDITGVFPGNYVTPLRSRDQQQLMHQWKHVPLQSTPYPNQALTKAGTNEHGAPTQSAITSTSQRIQSLHQPPELPPRQVSSTLPISSVWTKPLGHTVEAFFNRCSSKTNDNTKEPNSNEKEAGKQKENIPSASVAPSASSSGSSSTTSSAVQLMKRLAHIKSRSKSPSSTNTRQQQQRSPHAEATAHDKLGDVTNHSKHKIVADKDVTKNNSHFNTTNTLGHLHPVHVRSGSCPSQLLQSPPYELTAIASSSSTGSSTMAQIQENMLRKNPQHVAQQQRHQHPQQQQQQQHMQQIMPQTVGYGSQQLRGPKEHPHLQNARQSMDAAALRSMYNTSIGQQPQQQQQSANSANTIISNHRKSHSLDAAAALLNSSSDYATVGNNSSLAALVTTGNITAAAVAASATTKSTQSSRESRFRCIVPYPPNSEIELELQVGDIIYVQRRQKNGWYKGTHARTNKTGLFPASFVEQDI